MSKDLSRKLLETPQAIFSGCLHGLEREALRIDPSGRLALSPHPEDALGAALKHPYITTDFSESQIEYTTTPHPSLDILLKELELLCNHVRLHIDSERLWPFSMPAYLPQEKKIPIANYGPSPLGRQKHIYRRGLAHRYGAKMQTISGVHYNFSFGKDFWKHYFSLKGQKANNLHISEAYLGVMRNFLRHIYLMPYLFGNSPALHQSFLPAAEDTKTKVSSQARQAWQQLLPWQTKKDSLYAKYATSLRQSEIGYNHPGQWDLKINYNSLEGYLKSMGTALNEINPAYKEWSVEAEEQLSQAHLQIENEHYAPIRPKQKLGVKEGSLSPLEKHGIAYLELRCLDIQSGSCCGVDPQALCFIQLLLYHCLLEDSPPLETKEEKEIQQNYLKAVWEGRNANCKLSFNSQFFSLKDRALALCEKLGELANRLDAEHLKTEPLASQVKDKKLDGLLDGLYTQSLAAQIEKIKNIEATPSAQFLDTMLSYPEGYIEFGCALAQKQNADAAQYSFSAEQKRKMEEIRILSLENQTALEESSCKNP